MANEKHLAQLRRGVEAWYRWRYEHPEIRPNLARADLTWETLSRATLFGATLTGADLAGADLTEADLREADLTGAQLMGATLTRATLTEANLAGADLSGATLTEADLTDANLREATLAGADLSTATLTRATLFDANLAGADLSTATLTRATLRQAVLYKADLTGALLLETNFEGADLRGCLVYGIAAWNINLARAQQADLVITRADEPVITVDNLEVAQFIYLLLHNEKIREVIDTITSKAVLILGRFTPERKAVLDAIREELRRRNYLPILFDFERPTNRDFTETIMTLAGMCLFIIADITNPKSSPLELQATIPNYMVPFVPIIHEGEQPFSMFRDLKNKYPDWVLDVLAYDSASSLVRRVGNAVIRPALKRHDKLLMKKVQELQIRHVKDYPDDEELV
jgi:uncharacterized protein YjbI with pentapeptide repeats